MVETVVKRSEFGYTREYAISKLFIIIIYPAQRWTRCVPIRNDGARKPIELHLLHICTIEGAATCTFGRMTGIFYVIMR